MKHESAFPGHIACGPAGDVFTSSDIPEMMGMTLRDYFAGQVLAGISVDFPISGWKDAETAAKACYKLADAMLKERER